MPTTDPGPYHITESHVVDAGELLAFLEAGSTLSLRDPEFRDHLLEITGERHAVEEVLKYRRSIVGVGTWFAMPFDAAVDKKRGVPK